MRNVTRYEFEVHEGGGEVVISEAGGFVDYDDYLSQLQQADALQTSLNNIINAFGIESDGPVSKLVIDYVLGLVAENVAMKSFGNKLDEMHNDLNGTGTGIQGGAEVACQQVALEAAMEEFDAIKTPVTDAAIAEIGAKSIENAINAQIGKPCITDKTNGLAYINLGGIQDFAANLRAGRKG